MRSEACSNPVTAAGMGGVAGWWADKPVMAWPWGRDAAHLCWHSAGTWGSNQGSPAGKENRTGHCNPWERVKYKWVRAF